MSVIFQFFTCLFPLCPIAVCVCVCVLDGCSLNSPVSVTEFLLWGEFFSGCTADSSEQVNTV